MFLPRREEDLQQQILLLLLLTTSGTFDTTTTTITSTTNNNNTSNTASELIPATSHIPSRPFHVIPTQPNKISSLIFLSHPFRCR